MKKLLSIILSITMLFSMTAVAFAEEANTSGAREVDGIIKVGINAEFPPFEYMENDKILGFDVDLMNYIVARINYGVEFVNMSFDRLIPAVVSGEVDCAISAITATDERESVVDFTRPYLAANVTYKGEDSATEQLEMYSVVFKDGVADTKYLSRTPTTYERLFMLVNGTIEELISDGTIEKLIEKYDLNKASDGTADVSYEYIVLKSTVTDAKNNLEVPKKEAWEEVADVVYEGEVTTSLTPPSEWAAKDIDKAISLNILSNDYNYKYADAITREEFCNLAYNYIAEFGKDLEVSNDHKFTDTDNVKVEALSSLGIIKGKSETEFAPNDLLTREEAATILNRLINVVHPGLANTEEYFEFADGTQISDWAMNDIQRICNMGVMKGVGNNNFAPQDNYTTEQAIVTLVRVYASSGISKNDVTEGILYKNEKMNVQFEIPVSWQGKYFVDESVEEYIVLKHTAIAEKYEGAGAICSVYKEPDETVDATLNMLGNQTVVWQNQDYAYIVGRPTDVQHPIWVDRDDEDSVLASEYEEMAEGITHIVSTFSLINEVDVPVITNAENLSYAQIRDVQRQVNNGHFPWRIDYEQVVKSFLSGKGIDIESGNITELAGGADSVSLTYSVKGKEYIIELFKPIDTSEYGIWIVRTFEESENR